MKTFQFASNICRPILCNPIRKRTMADVDFTPKTVVRKRPSRAVLQSCNASAKNFFSKSF